MPSKTNKPRLYLALYVWGGRNVDPTAEKKFHWALLIGPKNDTPTARGTRYHAKDRLVPEEETQRQWDYAEEETVMGPTNPPIILVRLRLAKINDIKEAVRLLRFVPIRGGSPGWTCLAWVREALETLDWSRVLNRPLGDWDVLRKTAYDYCVGKMAQHRFDGKHGDTAFDLDQVPTLDLMEGKETIA